MKRPRLFALLLTLLTACSLLPAAASAEDAAWLVPPSCQAPAFSDTAGLWCEEDVRTVCEAGLMEGASPEFFHPATPLTNAQITVITARLHQLLRGGDGLLPDDGAVWYQSAVTYLKKNCSASPVQAFLSGFDPSIKPDFAYLPCTRSAFVSMLAGVLPEKSLPPRNALSLVPDSLNGDVLLFYRAGILKGTDPYGTFRGNQPLTRGAAAAMLARLVDPARRLTFTLQPFDLCRDVLQLEPETALLTVDGAPVPAALLVNQLCTSLCQWEGRADKAMEDTTRFWCDYYAPFQLLAARQGIRLSDQEQKACRDYGRTQAGYLGLSASYWQRQDENSNLNLKLRSGYVDADWKQGEAAYHKALEACSKQLLETAAPTKAFQSLDLRAVYSRLTASPFMSWYRF